ncbi:MAG: signal recognition particle subunit SRP19/SEC65 family protein [Thermoplasmata archaeon]|nr:signal recognition particle subunit SRP19/SEC65 family protein [Thermoplasmata archaeon]MCI4344896.1 signal recognition particle subunit SRP19/SEC65 family protein [Thermoplasmata archaeon]
MPDHFYVYPAYLRRETPRTAGRRVPKASAPEEVSLTDLVAAAKSLGFQATAEEAKQYPRQFHRYEGRMKVTKKAGVTKTEFLRRVAAVLAQQAPTGGKR